MHMVVRVHSSATKKMGLKLDGFVPVIERWTKPARKHTPVLSQVPVYPGWVFTPYSEERYEQVRALPGVRGFLRDGKRQLILVPDRDIDEMRSRPVETPVYEEPQWEEGDHVKVLGIDGWIANCLGNNEFLIEIGGNYPIRACGSVLRRA